MFCMTYLIMRAIFSLDPSFSLGTNENKQQFLSLNLLRVCEERFGSKPLTWEDVSGMYLEIFIPDQHALALGFILVDRAQYKHILPLVALLLLGDWPVHSINPGLRSV